MIKNSSTTWVKRLNSFSKSPPYNNNQTQEFSVMMRVPVFLSFFLFIQVYTYGQIAHSPCGEVFYDSFEYNLDQWNQVGNECKRTKEFSSSGVYGMQLRDNSKLASAISTKPLKLADYSQLTMSFEFTSKGLEDQENFTLEVSTDGGLNFQTQDMWVKGVDFENEETIKASINLDLDLSDETIFRFKCDASHNDDLVYIDEIKLTDCPESGSIEISSATDNTVIDIVSIKEKRKEGSLMLHSNPSKEMFTINMELLEGQSGSIEIYNKMGAKLSRSIFKYDHDGKMSFPIDYLENGNYSVCVKSDDDKLFVLRLVVGS